MCTQAPHADCPHVYPTPHGLIYWRGKHQPSSRANSATLRARSPSASMPIFSTAKSSRSGHGRCCKTAAEHERACDALCFLPAAYPGTARAGITREDPCASPSNTADGQPRYRQFPCASLSVPPRRPRASDGWRCRESGREGERPPNRRSGRRSRLPGREFAVRAVPWRSWPE